MPTCPPGCPNHKPLITATTGRGAVLPLPPFPTHTRVSLGPGLRFGQGTACHGRDFPRLAQKVPAGRSDSVPTQPPCANW